MWMFSGMHLTHMMRRVFLRLQASSEDLEAMLSMDEEVDVDFTKDLPD